MKTRSLTRTLIVGVLLAEFACALIFSVLALNHEMHGRRRGFDVMLHGRADSVLGAIQDAEDTGDNVLVDPAELPLPSEDAYAVLTDDGRLAGRSPNSSDELIHALEAVPMGKPTGYFNFQANGRSYRAIRQPGLRVIDREEQTGGLRRPVTILYAAPTAHLWNEVWEGVRFYLIATCLLVLITGIAIAWFLRVSLDPLRELALSASRVSAESWEFHIPPEALRTRELQPIAVSIEKLLIGLRAAFDRQRQFTGDAAHELKTSIALLKSSLQLIAMRERSKEEYQRGLEDLLTDTQRMEHLTTRMLTLARVEQSPFESDAASDLAETLTLVVERLTPAAELKGVCIHLNHAAPSLGQPALVNIDSHDADLLCSNLLLNAVQHSPAGTTVSAEIVPEPGQGKLIIADRGDGIAPEALPHIFDRFYRGDPSRSRANGGAGLGLAICKAIATRSGGSIAVTSTLGEGTEVTVTLPIRHSS